MFIPGFGYGLFWDSTYILVIFGALLCVIASLNVNSTFKRYSRISNMRGLTGAEAARQILSMSGISYVRVERVQGELTDHYDPRERVLRLSESVYDSTSVAAIGVAAHECGHAIQHAENYAPLNIRSAMIPICNFASNMAVPVLLIGTFFAHGSILTQIGIAMFGTALLVQLVTLPVEFNASARAVKILDNNNILVGDEVRHTKKVLTAAALTYVANAVAILLQLLRIIIIFGGRRDD